MDKNEFEHEFEKPNECSYEEIDEKKISEYYTKRRLNKNRMERKIRQGQMWIKRLRIFLRFIIIICLIILGYKLLRVHQWYLSKNIFDSISNKSLEIANNKIVPSHKVLESLRRTELPHTPIYRLETYEIKKNIMQLDPVEDVYIRRFWFPARLQIIIKEKTPVIIIAPDINVPPIAFFTREGKLIGRDYMPLDKSFKTILVLSYGTKGDDYRNWNSEKIKLFEKVGKAVKNYSKEDIEYIDVRNPKDIYVKIKTVNIRLGELDDTVFSRIQRISSILPQVKTLDKKIKYIDLRWKNTNYIKLD